MQVPTERPPMENQPDRPRSSPPKPAPRPRFSASSIFVLVILATFAAILLTRYNTGNRSQISFGLFCQELNRQPSNIGSVEVKGLKIYGEFKTPPPIPDGTTDKEGNVERYQNKFFTVAFPAALHDPRFDDQLRKAVGANYWVSEAGDNSGWVIGTYVVVTLLVLGAFWFMLRRTRDQVMGGGILGGFSKSPARRYEGGDKPVTFADVAGLEGVKNELEEVVQFLKNPAKFQRLGGRVPKGILLMGPPGTGKTLLGRAVAGEADVPFFSISGSEFIQMFVGVGASRVRDMFTTAKENAPSILFIDEIDAVGRHRGAGLGGGHDEREQTLNQILSEMDGFTQTESVIVVAATNRPDILDPALLRPGRFDRHITVDRPNQKGRLAIFKVHSRNIPLDDDVDLHRLAAGSVGLTGADIRNLVNEAAIWATRRDKDKVDMDDFEYARDKLIMGAKREEVLTGKEKVMVAYHEAGHALVAWLTTNSERVHKISIIPRGRALGATQLVPEEDRVNISESELHGRLAVWLAGRTAEKLIFDEYSAGAENDLKQATQVARRMVSHWGMSERLGPVAFRAGEEHPFLGKEMAEPREFSEHTAQVIDEEVVRILREASERAEQTLREHREKLDTLAHALEREEVLEERQIEELIGPSACGAGGSHLAAALSRPDESGKN